MNKKYLFSMIVSLLVLASCDYNEDNFEGFDNNPVTDVIYYEGEFTGKYPTEGYFSITQGKEEEGKKTIETALTTVLSSTYPYCDKGSSAKIRVKIADVLPSQLNDPETTDSYKLQDADYESMGTEKGQPGKYHNFDSKMDINSYLIPFCSAKYPNASEGDIVKITYAYYANSTTTDQSKFYKKVAGSWVEEAPTFDPDKHYTLIQADYDVMGTDAGEPGENDRFVGSDDETNAFLSIFLKNKYAYVQKDGMTAELTYQVENSSGKEVSKTTIFRFNGTDWKVYNPKAEIVLSVVERITVMKKGDEGWSLTNLISGTETVTLAADDYKVLVEWVKENKPEYMSTQNSTSEYYFGAATGSYNQINNVYNTWTKYYNVGGYLNDLDNDEIQAIMDSRLANEALAVILLPKMISNPNPDLAYEVVYNVYGGRGRGDYSMSFYYNKGDNKFEWDEMAPRMK